MGLKEVEQDILTRVTSKAEEIRNQGDKESTRIRKESEAKLQRLANDREQEATGIAEGWRKRGFAQARLQTRKTKLSSKRDALDEVYAEVESKIRALSAKERSAMLKKLIARGEQEIEAATIYTSPEDLELVKPLAHGLAVKGTLSGLGGVVLETKDRKISVDYTFETILERTKRKQLGAVAKKLFVTQ